MKSVTVTLQTGRLLFSVLVLVVIGFIAFPAHAIIYVNQNAPANSTQSGASWANAYRELRYALTNAAVQNATEANPVEIWIAKGTYKPTADTNRFASFVMRSHLRILGGFAGNETTDTHRLYKNAAVLSGDIGAPQAQAVTDGNFNFDSVEWDMTDPGAQDNCYNVLTCINAHDVILDQLVITAGYANPFHSDTNFTELNIQGMVQPGTNVPSETETNKGLTLAPVDRRVVGGGLYFQNSYDRDPDEVTVIINNCVFAKNFADGYGGAIGGSEAYLLISSSMFLDNSARLEGGAFWGLNQFADFLECDFEGNASTEGGGAVAYRTIPSDRTTPKTNPDYEMQRRAAQNVVAKTILVQKTAFQITEGTSVFHSARELLQDIASVRKPGTSSVGTKEVKVPDVPDLGIWKNIKGRNFRGTVGAIRAADKVVLGVKTIKGLYDAVAIGVAVGDIGFQLAVVFGADTNNAAAKGWRTFADGFNTYATPEGLSTLAAFAIAKEMDPGPTLEQQADQTKRLQQPFYNQAVFSTFRQCHFSKNVSAEGGAVYDVYNNLRFEGCSFDNNAAENGGAMFLSSWTTPIIMNCSFRGNFAASGQSGIANESHSKTRIINCTLVNNGSFSSNGVCVGVEMGSEVQIFNSILWGNTNSDPVNASGGADVFCETKDTITDPETKASYNAAGGMYGDWVGICDIASSCIQSLNRLPIGYDAFIKFPEHKQYTQIEIANIQKNFPIGDTNGTLELYAFYNVGQGIRPTLMLNGNIDSDPKLTGIVPASDSPVVDKGFNKRFANEMVSSITGADVLRKPRVTGARIDMGAVENQNGPQVAFTNQIDRIYVFPVQLGDGSGSSWENSTANLVGAMTISNAEIWVAAGTYYPTPGNNRNASFTLASNARVYGGFLGGETDLSERDFTNYTTYLSGEIGGPGPDDNSFHVVYNTNLFYGEIDGFTIISGRGDIGGGMLNSNASPIVRNCEFTYNQASVAGGAYYAVGGATPSLINCTFYNNSAPEGGAVYVAPSDYFLIQNCLFRKNSATTRGGALRISGGLATIIENSLFYSNSIYGTIVSGGAIYASGGEVSLYNCTVTENSILANTSQNVGGGGLEFVGPKNFSIYNSILWNNSVYNFGGPEATTEQQQIHVSGGANNHVSYSILQGLSIYGGGTSNSFRNPLFVDPASGNYQLRNYSPAVDAGGDTFGDFPTTDLAGAPRFANRAIDLGAYEFQLSPSQLSRQIKVGWTCDGSGGIQTFQLVTTNTAVNNFVWQVDRNDGSGFVNLVADSVHSGVASAVLTVTHPTFGMRGWEYQLTAGDFVSEAATLRASGPVVYVKASAAGANNGANWSNAFTNLQTALNSAAPCSEIWVAAGTYFPTNSSDRDAAFQLVGQVNVYGGFAGTETLLSHRSPLTNITILSGRIASSSDDLSNSRNLFLNIGGNPSTPVDPSVLDGFTLVGATDGSILNISASPTIQNCILIDDEHSAGSIINQGSAAPVNSGNTFVTLPFTVCGGGATISVTSSNNPGRVYQWQADSGGGFVPITPNADYTITSNSISSAVAITTVPGGTQYRFAIVGTSYVSPPLRMFISPPTVLYVNASVVGGSHDGSSWSNAYTDLKQAINDASSCVELWVARGTYSPGSDISQSASFFMKQSLGIYGGFAGTEINRNQRNWVTNKTILLQGVAGESIVYNRGNTPLDGSAVLDGFTFTNCTGGSAVKNLHSSPTIRNCLFTGLSANSIINDSSHPAIVGCTFSNNLKTAIYNQNSTPSISSCTFIGQNTGDPGGGIYNTFGSAPQISDCTFKNNTAGWGGGIANQSSSATILRCVFQGNSSGNGGAIWDSGTSVVNIRNSLFFGNGCPQFRGGAIADYGSLLTLSNCTIAANSASYSGGALLLQGNTNMLRNCIVWGNFATAPSDATDEQQQIHWKSGTLLLTNNIIQNLTTLPGANNSLNDPIFANPASDDYSLNGFSPAINAGNNAGIDSVDLAGNPRQFGANVDLGAYEYQFAQTNGVILLRSSPASQIVCEGNPVSFTIVGATNYTFVWQVSTNGGTDFFNATGAAYSITNVAASNFSTLSLSSTVASQNDYRFRVAISNFTSGAALLTVNTPSVIYVSRTATGANNGTSWTNAYTNLFSALAIADECSQVWVAKGTYTATNASGGLSAQLKRNVRIYGGFFGNETNFAQRNWTTNIARLVGSDDLPLFDNRGYSVPIDSSAVLDGFTLNAGSEGAMVNYTASPTVRNCTIEQVTGTAVENHYQSAGVFDTCVFRNNANRAMVNIESFITITNCLFTNNSSTFFPGGALQNVGGSNLITDSRFVRNSVARDVGGAIDSRGGTNIISRCIFTENSAVEAGAISFSYTAGEIKNSLFYNNSARDGGGAIELSQSPVIIRNCTVAYNTSPLGGGGGVFVYSGQGATAVNSIFFGNRDRFPANIEYGQIYPYAGTISISNSVIEGLSSYAGFSNQGFDPLFADSGNGNFNLTQSSPAINAGNNTGAGGESLDLNRLDRIFGSTVDIGAYEFTNSPLHTVALLAVPQSQSVCEEHDAFFTVTGYTNAASNFQWKEIISGVPVLITNNSARAVVTNGDMSTLIISNVTSAMHGKQFQFTIPSLSYTSAVFTLSVSTPDVLYVKSGATGDNSGSSWANACTNLSTAIANADACTAIWVAKGTYKPKSGSFVMKSGLKIYGGFFGNETNLAQRNWTTNLTLLTDSGSASVFNNSGYFTPIDDTAGLDGFTISSTNASFVIYNSLANPTFKNCKFDGCTGIAIVNQYASPLIESCVFTNGANRAILNSPSASPTITNCLFTANHNVSSQPGIICNSDSSPRILQCVFDGNTSATYGGALSDDNSDSVVINCVFSNNSARNGGAVNSFGSSNTFINCLFVRNHASFFRGGAIASASDTMSVFNCTFTENSASSSSYGGIYGYGGGVYQQGGTINFQNSIFWRNTDANAGTVASEQIYQDGGSQTVQNCCVQGIGAGNGNVSLDPLFAWPATNNYRLNSSSPLLNVGNNSYVSTATDLGGQTRIQQSTVDIGAYESSVAGAPVSLVLCPANQIACESDSANFTATVVSGTGSFAWEYNTGGGWNSFSGASGTVTGPPLGVYSISAELGGTSILTVAGTSLAMTNYQFRCTVGNGFSYQTPPAKLTVVPPTVIYVNAAAPDGGDGASWATALNHLQDALVNVNACTREVWVAGGTYNAVYGSANSFSMPPGSQVFGGFAGTEITRDQRNIQAHPTILTGSNATVVSFDTHGGIYAIETNTLIDGFTITGGYSGVTCFHANPTVRNCNITSNSSFGVNLTFSTGVVENCSITLNNGGVWVVAGQPLISRSRIAGNYGRAGVQVQSDGSVDHIPAQPRLVDCVISGNSATGIDSANGGGRTLVVNSTISGNSGSFTGGIEAGAGSVVLTNSIVWKNRATGGNYTTEQQQMHTLGGGILVVQNSCIQGLNLFSGNGNTGSDPLFQFEINPQTAPTSLGDFHLQSCSPLIGAGINVDDLPATDFDGSPRIVGTTVDLGAYEFQSTPTTPLIVTAQPIATTNCAIGTNQFIVVASGSGLAYQWEVDRQNGFGFVTVANNANFSGATTATLTLSNLTSDFNGSKFRCFVTGGAGCSVTSSAATLTVRPSRWFVNVAATNNGNGLSWSNAFNNMATAMNNPLLDPCGSEIWVAAGTYNVVDLPFKQGVSVYGGFNGTETDLNQRDWGANLTILHGGGTIFHGEGAAAVTGDPLPLDAARLDGFILENATYAVGLYDFANPTIANCVFRNNDRGVFIYSSMPTIQDCAFTNNNTGIEGDSHRIWYLGPMPVPPIPVNRCVFQGNGNGAIHLTGGTDVNVRDSLFTGNNQSGAISANSVEARNCTFVGNRHSSPVIGSAIDSCLAEIYNCIFWNNSGLQVESRCQNLNNHLHNSCIQCADPLFVQSINSSNAPTTAGDFHLTICSPLINAGANADVFSAVELDGEGRIFDGNVDLGAYEFQSVNTRFTSQPVDQTGAYGTPVQFGVAVNRPAVAYQWQVNGGGGFVELTDDVNHANATNITLSLTNQVPAMDNDQYRCRVTTVDGCTIISASATYHHRNVVASGSSPINNGNIPPDGNLNLSFNQNIAAGSVSDSSVVIHAMQKGRLRSSLGDLAGISATGATITIDPAANFHAGEPVWVTATRNVQTTNGYGTEPFVWGFRAGTTTNSSGFFNPGASPQTLGGLVSRDLAVGDLDRDGDLDVLQLNDGANKVWLNDGAGAFTYSAQTPGSNGLAVASGDVNGDGYLDAIILNQNGACEKWINNGAGVLIKTQTFAASAKAIALGDLDGDGSLDLFIACSGPDQVWFNNGAGTFSDSGLRLGNEEAASVALGDLNGDGILDVFVANRFNQPATIWLNSRFGVFSKLAQLPGNGDANKVALGDLNSDGFLDAVVASAGVNAVWTNNSSGIFSRLYLEDATQPGDSITQTIGSAYFFFPTNTVEKAIDDVVTDGSRWISAAVNHTSAFVITPSIGRSIVVGIAFQLQNNSQNPAKFTIEGSTDGLNFTFISSNAVPQPFSFSYDRFVVLFTNDIAYTKYRVMFHDGQFGAPGDIQAMTEMELLHYAPKIGSGGTGLSLADVNGDGNLDILLSGASGPTKIWLNDGVANFSPTQPNTSGAMNGAIATGDLDNDGDVDFVQSRGGANGNIAAFNFGVDFFGDEDTAIALNSTPFANKFFNSGAGSLAKVELRSLPANGVLELNGSSVAIGQEILLSDLGNLVYLPNTNFFSSDFFTWRGSTGGIYVGRVFQTLIVVNNVQESPVVADDFIEMSQAATATALTNGATSVLNNDSDPDGGLLSAELVQNPIHGTVDLHQNGTFAYIHDGSEPTDSFVYRARNAFGTVQATVFITVTNFNYPVTDITMYQQYILDGTIGGEWIGYFKAVDLDPDAVDFHTCALASGTGDDDNGAFLVSSDTLLKLGGHVNFLTKSNYSVRIRASDSHGSSFEKVFVLPVLTTPVTLDQSVNVTRDTPMDITLTSTNLDGNPITGYILNSPSKGVLTGTGPLVNYAPNARFVGTDSFTFQVSAIGGVSAPGTVSITVTGPNDPPVASHQSANVAEDTPTGIVLTGFDPNSDTLSFAIATPPQHGTLGSLTNDTVVYTPETNYNGSDSFTFIANDSHTNSDPGTVSLNVTPVNDAPIPRSRSVTIMRTVSGYAPATPTYLEVDDPDDSFFNMRWTVLTLPQHGAFIDDPINSQPYLIYYANDGFQGTDSFTYTVNDGHIDSPTNATFTITVVRINNSPSANFQEIEVPTNTPMNLTLTGSDPDNDPLNFAVTVQPVHGSLSGTPPNLTYTPETNYYGVDSFKFMVYDDFGGTNYNGKILLRPPFSRVVYRTDDANDPGSLRRAFGDIENPFSTPGDWTILFDPELAGQTVYLSQSPGFGFYATDDTALAVQNYPVTLTIDGVGAPGVTLERDTNGPAMRLFYNYHSYLTLRNLTLRNGLSRGVNGLDSEGGGGGGGSGMGGLIFNEGGTVTLGNVVFADSQAVGGDGGNHDSLATSTGDGGGYNGGPGGTARNPGNGAFIFGGGGGAGLDADVGQPGAGGYGAGAGGGTNSVFAAGGPGGFGGGGGGGNFAGGGGGAGLGGAIYNRAGTIYLETCVFTNIHAVGGPGGSGASAAVNGEPGHSFGGSLFNWNGAIYLYDCHFINNSAENGHAQFDFTDYVLDLVDIESITTSNPPGADIAVEGAIRMVPPMNPHLTVSRGFGGTLRIIPTVGNFGGFPQPASAQVVSGVGQGAVGAVTFTSTGVTYAHNGSGVFTDSFTVYITGPHGGISTNTVTVTINDVQLPPVAIDDYYTVHRGSTTTLPVLANDYDPNNDLLRGFTLNRAPTNGTLRWNSTNMFYTQTGPGTNDFFKYRMYDSHFSFATGAVFIAVVAPLPLQTTNDFANTDQDTLLDYIPALDNDEPNGLVSLVSFNTNGTLGLVAWDGYEFTYDPDHRFNRLRAGETNVDSFTYVITDGAEYATGTVAVAVSGLNDVPIASTVLINRFPGTKSVKIAKSQMLNIFDADYDVLTFTSIPGLSDNGNPLAQSASELSYTPGNPFADDTFHYAVNDGHGGEATNIVNIAVVALPAGFMLKILTESSDFTLGFSGTPGQNYVFQYTTNLSNPIWIDLGVATEGLSGFYYWQDHAPADVARYYRVR